MIEVRTKEGATKMKVEGTAQELTADMLIIIEAMYNGFAEDDEELAKLFAQCLKDNIDDCFKSAEEKTEEIERISKEINEVVSNLSDLLKGLMSNGDSKHLKS